MFQIGCFLDRQVKNSNTKPELHFSIVVPKLEIPGYPTLYWQIIYVMANNQDDKSEWISSFRIGDPKYVADITYIKEQLGNIYTLKPFTQKLLEKLSIKIIDVLEYDPINKPYPQRRDGVIFISKSYGKCPKCGKHIWVEDDRFKDQNNTYWHTKCWDKQSGL